MTKRPRRVGAGGITFGTLGLGGCYRRLRTLLLQEFCVGAEVSVVGNGCTAVSEGDPLTVTLVETGAALGSLDWSAARVGPRHDARREAKILDIVKKATKKIRAYLATPFEKDASGALRHPGRFRGSGSSSNLHADPPKKKGKKGKKKK